MISKIYYQDSQEELYRASDGVMVSVFEPGELVGNIKKASAKSAFLTDDDLNRFRPDKDHFLMHLVAMGATEYYGQNRNQDGYKKATLERDHPTFVSHGHYFEEHNNRDPKIARGTIKFSAYNPDMNRVELFVWGDIKKAAEDFEMARAGKPLSYSMSCRIPFDVCNCLPGNTLIRVYGGWKPIEQVTVGDLVWTHKGRYKKVTKLFRRVKTTEAVVVTCDGLPESLTLTEEHPMYVVSSANATENQQKFVRRQWAGDDFCATAVKGFSSPVFVDAKKIQKGDLALFPVRNPGKIVPKLDPWMAGLALADGSVFGQKRGAKRQGDWREQGIQFSLGADKLEIIEALRSRCAQLELPCKIYPESDGKAAFNVHVHNRELASEFLRLFGRAKDKHVDEEVFSWRKEDLLLLLAGWLDGDGSQDTGSGYVRGCSTLPAVGRAMWEVALVAGLPGSLSEQAVDSEWGVAESVFVLGLASRQASILSEYSAKVQRVEKSRYTASGFFLLHEGQKFYATRVADVQKTSLTHLYNFEVEDDHSYVAGHMLTHNCCEHKAAKIALHCRHMKDTPGQYLEEFKKYAYVDNPHCTFFDISKVKNPADRTAHYLAYRFPDRDQEELLKAASQAPVILGSDWAEFEGVKLPEYDADEPLEWTAAHRQVLEKLARADQYAKEIFLANPRTSDPKVAFVKAAGPYLLPERIGDEALETLRKATTATVMRGLAKSAAVLPFTTFVAYITGASEAEAAADEKVKSACFSLPGVFRDLLSGGQSACGNMHREFQAGSEFMSDCDPGNDDAVQKFMDEATQKYGIKAEPARSRVIQITIKTAARVSPQSQETKGSAEGRVLAEAYAQYLVQSLVNMEKAGTALTDQEILALAGYTNSLPYR